MFSSPETTKLRLHLPSNKLTSSTSVVDSPTIASQMHYAHGTVANTFSPVILKSEQEHSNRYATTTSSTTNGQSKQLKNDFNLGRLDGLVSSPNRSSRVRVTDSKKIAAILLETNIVELQRHLLTITVQNQVRVIFFYLIFSLYNFHDWTPTIIASSNATISIITVLNICCVYYEIMCSPTNIVSQATC